MQERQRFGDDSFIYKAATLTTRRGGIKTSTITDRLCGEPWHLTATWLTQFVEASQVEHRHRCPRRRPSTGWRTLRRQRWTPRLSTTPTIHSTRHVNEPYRQQLSVTVALECSDAATENGCRRFSNMLPTQHWLQITGDSGFFLERDQNVSSDTFVQAKGFRAFKPVQLI